MNETTNNLEAVRARILEAIDRSDRGKWSIKIKTLMAEFGFMAVQRVRQSSFLTALDTLTEWGIEYRLPGGNTANDYITLSRSLTELAQMKPASPQSSAPSTELSFVGVSPLAFLFHIGETLDEVRSQCLAVDIQNAVWSFHPVCIVAEAGDEFFSFACGFFAAIMRRRALMVRHGVFGESAPLAPELITVDRLKRLLGQIVDPNLQELFPKSGAIYILQENPEDFEDDEMIAFIREGFIPHTYRLRAKFATTSGDQTQGQRAMDAPGFHRVVEWISTLAGSLQLSQAPSDQLIDLASLLAEALQARDTLLERQALRPPDAAFRTGFESTEHMLLKSALLNGLRRRYPGDSIAVEELMDPREDDEFPDLDSVDRSRRDKPDLRISNMLWVEVETMRALSFRGSNPFFVLDSKLRRKLNGMRAVQEVWLMVPSDVALLASEQLSALVRNLNTLLGSNKVRYGFVDVLAETPVFVDSGTPPTTIDVRLSGAPWRTRKPAIMQPLSRADIAGYGDLKERLREDILDPLLDPEKYSKHGIFATNGLLLYGLPGCGKSLIGRVLAGEAGLVCRFIMPSDLTSMWLGEGVMKTRALFDWALKQSPCLLVLDELDAIAPQRREVEMHTDEKRQVNELLAQLDRISGRNVVVVATTNYVQGIDRAIQRSGRFDVRLPVFPPDKADRVEIFDYYLSPLRLKGFKNTAAVDKERLATEATLFTPADIKTVVHAAARQAIRETVSSQEPSLSTENISRAIVQHHRSLHREMVIGWARETAEELGHHDKQLIWLEDEISRAFGRDQ